ncbi:MAG: toll/interleukin-1 receptor domain-containing protein [Gaiellaceae bacterium]
MSVLAATDETPRVFLSYRRADTQPSALLLYRELTARFGEGQICMDIFAIPGGGDWFEYIERTLGKSALVLALIGPNWLTATDDRGRRLDDPDDVLRQELGLALKREVRVIPLLVQGAEMPKAGDLPDDLRGIVDRFPVRIGAVSLDADVADLAGMVGKILDELRADGARGLADEGEFERARATAQPIANDQLREEVLAYIDGLDRPQVVPGQSASLRECLDGAGLKYHDFEEAFVIPFGGQRADQVLAFARELADGTTFLSVELDAYTGKKKNKVQLYQRLLNLSFVNYVKALALAEGRFALAAEVPPGALTPEICDGLIRGLVALGDIKDQDELASEESWQMRIQFCKFAQQAAFSVDAEQARADVGALLEAAGASPLPGGLYTFDLELGEGPRPLSLYADAGVVSLITPWPARPGGDLNKLTQLLELNRAVNVAKVGLDSSGEVRMLYEVPGPVPDLAARLKEQLTILVYGLILRL